MNRLRKKLTTALLCAVLALTTGTVARAQESTPEPTPTFEELAPVGDTVTTVTVTTEPAPSNTVQSFLAVLSGMLIDLIVPVFAAMSIALLYRVFQFVKSKISVEQEMLIRQLVNMAVQAAEQTGLNREIADTGEAKKQFAITTLQDALRARGLGVFADYIPELEARIEAAINQQIQIPYPPFAPVEPVETKMEAQAKDLYQSAGRP